jgi:HD-like signal output (HDOD) protein
MKARHELTAQEVGELHQLLDRKLDGIGLSSQPEVALKLLELSSKPNAQLAEYSNIIRSDQAVAGRVLRLANSAFFAQRRAVTAIDRACVVLGVDRLKAVALGFHLSRAAQAPGDKEYSRQIWGESLFRACLASQAARLTAPALVSEAFVIGLMMDAGLPIMGSLAGEGFRKVRTDGSTPGRLFRLENERLAFTHVDVMTVLARRWKLPEMLAKPLEWHHTKPPETKKDDPLVRLHRIAYVVGLVEFSPRENAGNAVGVAPVTLQTPGVGTVARILALGPDEIKSVVQQSAGEYSATIEMFKDIASGIQGGDNLLDAVQLSLTRAVDNLIERDLTDEVSDAPQRFQLAGQWIELGRESDGSGMAYLFDSKGNRLLAHRFQPASTRPAEICEALGIDAASEQDVERLRQSMARMAA